MKQTRLMKMLFVPAALSLFAACSSDNDIVGDKNPTEDKGVTLTINATAGADAAMSRVQYNTDYSVEWTSTDQVYAFAGSTANAGKCGITTTADKHNAKLTVTLPTTPKNGDKITAYVANNGISAVNAKTEGLGDQVEVDYSKQDGTYAGATSRCVLFGETTYNSESELSMNFEYQTTFLKLTLNFPETTVAGEAALYLTGDNVYSISRMNTTGANAGQLGNQNGFTITVPSVNVLAGKAENIYIAMYPGAVQNVKLQAVMADGKTYEFTLGNANLAAGKVYNIKKNGTVVDNGVATSYAGGTGGQKNPYQISNLAQLNYLREQAKTNANTSGKYFVLTNDIVINGAWTPIDNFHGTFDGDGHAILGNIKLGGTKNELGLFGVLGYNGVVKNLTNKANITTDESVTTKAVGGIVGRINHTGNAIKNCVNKGIINSKTQYIGGILGDIYAQDGKTDAVIEACRNEGYINCTNASPRFGGIVGSINGNNANQKIIIKGCSTKDVSFTTTATTAYTGGVLGYIVNPTNANQITITACWTENLSFPKVGTNRGIVASTSSIEFKLNYCWTNADNLISSTAVTPNNCYKKADNKLFSEWVTEANAAWGSTEYEFNADGTIKVKK
jgi:hypothetical protein